MEDFDEWLQAYHNYLKRGYKPLEASQAAEAEVGMNVSTMRSYQSRKPMSIQRAQRMMNLSDEQKKYKMKEYAKQLKRSMQ